MRPSLHRSIPLLALLAAASACAGGVSVPETLEGDGAGEVEPAAAVIHRHRTADSPPPAPGNPHLLAPASGFGPSNGITYQGGVVMGTVNVYLIWYGAWSAADKAVLQDLIPGLSGSAYWHINTTYFDSTGRHVSPEVTLKGETTDAYSHGIFLNDSAVEDIVADTLTSGALPKDPRGVYFVLSSADVSQQSNNGSEAFCTDYCGWHWQMVVGLTRVQYSWVGNAAAQCPASCGVQSPSANGRPGADAMASVVAHELEEAATDPDGQTGWTDGNGENADKCAWTFGPTYPSASSGGPANVHLGSRDYLIQKNWVNAAGGYCAMRARAAGDQDGNGRSDIVAVGAPSFIGIPVARANGDGSFTTSYMLDGLFHNYASQSGAKLVTGDFDGDGLTDVAATGALGWTGTPIAFSHAGSAYTFSNQFTVFSTFSSQPGAKVLAGDFDGDGKTDLVALGVSAWTALPVAFSNGDGTFTVTNLPSTFNSFASQPGVKLVAGDFNGDGWTDIAATGVSTWTSVPIAFSNGDGTFNITNVASTFNSFSSQPGAKVLAGDFDGDGRADLIATGVASWNTLPIATSKGDGSFTITNLASTFNSFSSQSGAKVVVGDFTGEGRDDLAATGVPGWNTLPVALSNGDGTFVVKNLSSSFNGYSSASGAAALSSWL